MRTLLRTLSVVAISAVFASHAQAQWGANMWVNEALYASLSLPQAAPRSGTPIPGTITFDDTVYPCTASRQGAELWLDVPGGTIILHHDGGWVALDESGQQVLSGVWTPTGGAPEQLEETPCAAANARSSG